MGMLRVGTRFRATMDTKSLSNKRYLAATSAFVSNSSLKSRSPAALKASDCSRAIGNEFVLEKRTEAMTNFSSSLEKRSKRDPTLATIQEMVEKRT